MIKSCWQYFLIGFVLLFLSSYAFGGAWLGTKIETDSDGDGDIDTIIYAIYDAAGTWTESRYDNNADGTMDSISYYTYNSNGYYQVAEQDLDANGSIDKILYFSQSDNGKLSITEYDNDADGTIDTFNYYTCDDVNLPTIMKHYEGSGAYGGASTLVSTSYYTYDANCNQIQREDDNDADGQIDEITYNTYDEQCRLSVVKTDTDNDGDFESVLQNNYDNGGLICRTEVFSEMEVYGMPFTSHFIYDFTNTYDENGYATKIETHMYGSETIYGQTVEVDSHVISYTTWEYFENAEGSNGEPYASECGCSGGQDTLEDFASAFGSHEGYPGYDQRYDTDQDGDVDGLDIVNRL